MLAAVKSDHSVETDFLTPDRLEVFFALSCIDMAVAPGYESQSMVGAFAPVKTPSALVTRLNQEFVKALERADVCEKFFNVGVETVGSTPEEFGARVKADMSRLGKVIRDAGLREK